MKKLMCGLVAGALLVPATASAQVTVTDPTPTNSFTGTYACYAYEAETASDPGEYDANGNPGDTHNRVDATCTQEGYVSVGPDGVVACNGNENVKNPRDGTALQGYIWVGPDNAASNPTGQTPGGGHAGAGNNHEDADSGEPTGDSPCP